MTELKTAEALLAALRRASDHTPTADELQKQRISFIMGSVSDGSTLTRTRVEQVLAEREGRKAS